MLKEIAKQRKELQKLWDGNGAAIYEANREYKTKHGKEMDAAARSKAIKDATMNGVFNAGAYACNLEAEKTRQDAQNERMANKMTRFEKEEEVRWQASQKASEEKQTAEELQAGYAAYYAAMRQAEQEAKSNWWEQTKSFVNENIIQPANVHIYQPIIKPVTETTSKAFTSSVIWVNEHIYQPYIKPEVDRGIKNVTAGISWVNENVYQPYIKPEIDRGIQNISTGVSWLNEYVYQPYIKPEIEREIHKLNAGISWVNEKLYQPYIKPVVDQASEKLTSGVAWVNERIYQPFIQPKVDKVMAPLATGLAWINQNIYQPIFQPVVSDINKYLYQPLSDKVQQAWDQYSEWVHGALDAAGLIPGFGEIADGLNGLIYLGEGRYVEAAISAAAMIPILGDLGKAGKWAVKIGSEVVEIVAETGIKTALKEIAENAAEEAVEKVVKETLDEGLEKAAREALENAAEKAAENALERSAKEAAQVALAAVTQEAGEQISTDLVKEVAEKSLTEFVTGTTAKQVAKDAAEKTVKVEINYPDGLLKYQEFVSEMERISEKVKTAIPDGKPTQLLDNMKPLYREITDAPLALQQEFTQLQKVYSQFTDVPLEWDQFMQVKQLYSQAEDATPALHDLIKKLAQQTNGTPQFRPELKDVERVLEKMADTYDGDASRLTDITAGRIVYDDLESLYRALDDIHTEDQLVYFKDRFLEPQASGYRDVLMNVELPNGHFGELRLEVEPMNKAAQIEHKLYEMRRSIEDLNRPLTPEEIAIVRELKEQSQLILGEAWKEVIANFVAK